MFAPTGPDGSTLFLLSPARCSGERAGALATSERSSEPARAPEVKPTVAPDARSQAELGEQLRAGTAAIGDVFAWLSALYFRGKLTYARRFGTPLIMAPGRGLCAPETRLSATGLRAMGAIAVESPAFVSPLRRDAERVATDADARVVLLGSIATGKYLDTLLEVFGERLLFPRDFVGRGDMSRGGLLLRATRSGDELDYRPVIGATLRGTRPARLPRP